MRNIKSDVGNTVRLIENPLYEGNDNIFRPYFNTNEELDDVLSITKIDGSDIFCVQASSDHMFKCILGNAKSIDTFDINYLAKYFFYLKRNYLLFYGKVMDITATKEELYEVAYAFDLEDEDELEAHLFWKEFLPLVSINQFFDLFYIHPRETKFDLELLKQGLKNFKLNFHLVNMFENTYYTDKKYDVVILSNIMESLGINSKSHELLNRLVKKNGEVLCSNVSTFNVDEHSMYERAKMEEYFYYDRGLTKIDGESQEPYQVSYKYVKK